MTQEDYLAHHGILGQKWGVRRYQNADGSLTEAGKLRYAHAINKANLTKTSLYESKVDKRTSKEVSRQLKKHWDAFDGYTKAEKAETDYENKFWKNKDAVRKCANMAVDDHIKKYGLGDMTRNELLSLYIDDDLGQSMFYDYYLPSNPKAKKEYDALEKASLDAYNKRKDAIKEICEDVLGPNGEKTSFSVVKKEQVNTNGKLSYRERNATLNEILKREINRQTIG